VNYTHERSPPRNRADDKLQSRGTYGLNTAREK
jgi:hypothetical protein